MADGNNLILGNLNTSNSVTTLNRNGSATNTALTVVNQNGSGIRGEGSGNGIGVRGNSHHFYAVYGSAPYGVAVGGFATTGQGVWGESNSGIGVRGQSKSQVGVSGVSDTAAGVHGHADNATGVFGSSVNRSGVFGNSSHGLAGVLGNSRDNLGVAGTSIQSVGVAGFSENAIGVFGEAKPRGLAEKPRVTFGVLGRSQRADGRGVVGVSQDGVAVGGVTTSGFAGFFEGNVAVKGNFTVFNGAKSAAVQHPDGSYRRLYALESPESWFEDFGRGEMIDGRAQIDLDPDFAALVLSDSYHVFLTPEGDSNGLYVNSRTPRGFVVQEQQGGRSSLQFSYRVVAKRKDIPGERLAKVEVPPLVIGADIVVDIPEPPELPAQPEPLERPDDQNTVLPNNRMEKDAAKSAVPSKRKARKKTS
jgi:hypothetical protein